MRDAILTLTNQRDGLALVQDAFWGLGRRGPLRRAGFPSLRRPRRRPRRRTLQARALVLMKHGLITWVVQPRVLRDPPGSRHAGGAHRVGRARRGATVSVPDTAVSLAWDRLAEAGPVLRGQLARPTGDADRAVGPGSCFSHRGPTSCLRSSSARARRTRSCRRRSRPTISYEPEACRSGLTRRPGRMKLPSGPFGAAIEAYRRAYDAYVERHKADMQEGLEAFDPSPRVVLAAGPRRDLCGRNARDAAIARDSRADARGEGARRLRWAPTRA